MVAPQKHTRAHVGSETDASLSLDNSKWVTITINNNVNHNINHINKQHDVTENEKKTYINQYISVLKAQKENNIKCLENYI